ncbi:CHASE3 domain-containing protein [Paraflavisolibacter sp. H34]|uniref:sensor histidine kinase n=1 Tax=Huijunlia imazamoxiresistens TaxID=3127457 RepID=UPI00301B2E07
MQLSARAERSILIALSVALVLLTSLLFLGIHDLIQSYQRVAHSTSVKLKLEQTLSNLREVEACQRAFLLTWDQTFLPPKERAQEEVKSELLELRQLIRDNPFQEENLANLEELVNRRFSILDLALRTFLTRRDSGQLVVHLVTGKEVMERLRWQIDFMMQTEDNVLRLREATKNKYVYRTPLAVLSLLILTLFALAYSYYRIGYRLKLSNRYSAELQEKNKELAHKNKELEKSAEELLSFNFISSHDLREPLRKIRSFNSAILFDQAISGPTRQLAGRIETSAGYMQLLLDDLLVYTQIGLGERQLKPVDLMEVLEEIKLNMKELLEEHQGTLEYEHLPVVSGIHFQLFQLFENLISNSLKYRNPHQAPHIVLSCQLVQAAELPEALPAPRLHSHYVKLSFSDNGIGFDQKYAEKVFGLFQRLHTKDKYGGTGIGLTLCRKIVENHDGIITVSSAVNKGTTFHIFLPGL